MMRAVERLNVVNTLNLLPRPQYTASGSISPMPEQQRLRQMLEQLHTELQRAPATDDRSRMLLERAVSEIQTLLNAKTPEKRAESVSERLRELVDTFEETHPALTEAIGRVVDALATMGI